MIEKFDHVPPCHWRLICLITLLFAATGCASATDTGQFPTSALEPQGPAAANLAELWWIMFTLGTGVFLLITFIVVYVVFLRGPRRSAGDVDQHRGGRWIVYGGLVLPVVVLTIVFVFTLRSMQVLAHQTDLPLVIQVVGRLWWWEIRYPDQNVITANEIHIPVGYPVEIQLTSSDVIHSFWVPQLHGKVDTIPGSTNILQIQADEAGIYRGICAEYCGIQHAKMHFLVVAQSAADFSAWLDNQQQPAGQPATDLAARGQEVFFEVGCATCHAINGTAAISAFGPDLTHFASRYTLGSASLPNNRGNLAGWVVNAQSIKPGSRMPPVDIPAEDLQPLLDYLEALQ